MAFWKEQDTPPKIAPKWPERAVKEALWGSVVLSKWGYMESFHTV